METPECYLGLGLILGVLIGALFSEGNTRRKAALAKIRALEKEQQKAGGIVKKARERRWQGVGEMPGALLLILLSLALMALAVFLMSQEAGF